MFGHQAGDSTRDYYKTFRYFVHLVREIPIWKNIPIHDSIYRHMQYDYDNEATWACLQTYEHLLIQEDIRYGFGGGDSGGPVVCGGHYIGVAAGAANPEHRGEKISLFTPHVEMLWENGFNQRRDMIAEYDRIRQNLERRKLRPPFDKKLNADVFDEPLLQASPRILDNVSLIITTMLVRLLL
ncbi:hypothetical protein GE061_004934 [Apolygus lucorum]|uniref:Peptidase S1 domain-containing protein n=1 Tax=Apolygus lucorum TaxID=248454 RepID=A0A8S9WWK3_APOLU|nr:hypothetical protein GE061_004934 [Apolygus lucorum]